MRREARWLTCAEIDGCEFEGRPSMTTIADIAKQAGVSVSTVSYVLSGKRPISAETKERVRAAITELDYHPHAPGRALASRRTRQIAVLYPSVTAGLTEFQLEFFTAAAEAAAGSGYAFQLSTAPVTERALLDLMRSGAVDGLILMEVRLHDWRVDLLRQHGFPFTLIGHCAENDGIDFVELDFEVAAETVVDHLAQFGHRDIALVLGSEEQQAAEYGPAVRSLKGFECAVARCGIAGTVMHGGPTFEAGQTLARRLAALPELTAAVVVSPGVLAGLVAGTYDCGRCIPEELSLVAMVPRKFARLFTPALTTIDFPAAQMGRLGAEMLIRRLEGGADRAAHVLLHGELIAGRSTAWEAASRHASPAPIG
jgi:DNA-binding LacI/PurR family transcriptional regulator